MQTAKDNTSEDQDDRQQMINKTKDDKSDNEFTTGGAPADAKRKKYIKWGIIGAIILIVVILAIVLPITLTHKDNDNPTPPPPTPPTPGPPFPDNWNSYEVNPADLVNSTYGYEGVIKSSTDYLPRRHQLALEKLFASSNGSNVFGVNHAKMARGVNNQFSKNLRFKMGMRSWRIAHFELTDNDTERYTIPTTALPNPTNDESMRLDMLGFKIDLNPFSFSFSDPLDSSNVYVDTTNQSLVFMDKFVQMDFKLPSQRIYGFGERVREFNLTEGTWTMWAIGQNSPYDDGTGRLGVYGVHPFILVQGKQKGDFFGMYFRSSNAQSPVLKYTEDGSLLSYLTTGGKIEIFFFIHGTAQEIIKMYQSQFGTPRLPPFWSMGWHQASYKWENLDMVKNVTDSYASEKFPLDVVYLDIPYMDNYTDFTVNTTAFPNLTTYVDSLHSSNIRFVVIVDAGISADNLEQQYYKLGNDLDVFIKSGQYKSETYNNNLILKVWPDKAVFVDWFNEKSKELWGTGLYDLYSGTHFDGLWIDMNEPTGFEHGEHKPEDAVSISESEKPQIKTPRFLYQDTPTPDYEWYSSFSSDSLSTYLLPFIPRYINQYNNNTQNFDNWTLSLNASHPGMANATEFNLHNLYGHMMANRTFEYLTSNSTSPLADKRPFILTRSTFTSTGKYASHWLGDNYRDWNYLKLSIPGIMNMNMFGIPHVGADICGFFGEARDDEMCARWIQLGAFYPFARLHYDRLSDPTEPYLLSGTYKDIAKRSMYDRYQYIRQIYTCLFEASQNGGTCYDPLFYYYPTDDNLFQNYEQTLLVAGAFKVTPILNKLADNETTISAYFPNGTWVDINNPANIITGSGTFNLSTTGQSPIVHLRPGAIATFQNNSDMSVNNTSQLSSKPISLLVNRDENNYATGSLFLDQGETLSELNNKNYEYYTLTYQANSIQNIFADGNRGAQNHLLGDVRIFNAADMDVSVACYLDKNLQPHMMQAEYLDDIKTVVLTPQSSAKFNNIHSIHFAGSTELSVCSTDSFGYTIVDGVVPDLTSSNQVFIELQHAAGILPNVNFTLQLLTGDIVNLKWTWALNNGSMPSDKRTPREVPQDIIATDSMNLSTSFLGDFVTITDQPFKVSLFNKGSSGNTNFFTLNGFVYDEYLNWINATVFTTDTGDKFKGVFGLGERANKDFFFKDGVYGMWTRDSLTPDETGSLPGNNMYGVHPIYMFKHATSTWVGAFYKNANAQDWWIKNNSTLGSINLATISTGGYADIYIMKESTPDKLVAKYFTIVGNPIMIPQWALGWNQCRWGYRNLSMVKEVVQKYSDYSIPLDVQWSDIDYLNLYRNFEYDNVSFAGLPDFVKNDLHGNNMKWVPIIDAGLAYRPDGSYHQFNTGLEKDVFMKINDGDIFIGQVWPSDAAYPDYFAENTVEWWQQGLTDLQSMIPFDGLWEDMNEASNFCHGVCYQRQKPATQIKSKLKYIPTGRDLEYKSMALDAKHANGYQQIDTHSYYGTQMVKASHEWFTKNNMRTFIIERSSFAGMGKFASRWLGDNFSTVSNMAYSITGVMLQNMFGITLAGSDICGFIGDTNPELCTKWHIVGAFYPFSRNHNNWGQISQEPWVFENDTVNGQNATKVMKAAIKTKYMLIRYYYSNLFQISNEGSGTFYKPLFFEFPDDDTAYSNVGYNVMLGSGLKLSINAASLTQDTTEYYFPAGVWCSVDGTEAIGTCFNSTSGVKKNFSSTVTDYQLHLRQGQIVPLQDTKYQMESITIYRFNTTYDLQQFPIDLHVLGESSGTDTNWIALGTYINDDGVSLDYQGKYNHYEFKGRFSSPTISFQISMIASAPNNETTNCTAVNRNDYLYRIFIYNADNYGNNNSFGYTVNATLQDDSTVQVGTATYSDTSKILTFHTDFPVCLSTIKELIYTPLTQ